jgi:hypothetical protein
LAALAAAASTAIGALLMATAVVAVPGLRWNGYVSEAGVASSGHAGAYRLGVAGLALGQALLAAALWLGSALSTVDGLWIVPAVVGLLAADAAFGAVSAAVSCSPGCPLPPHQTPTARDLVHGGASILAVGLMSLAMLGLALGPIAASAGKRASAGLIAASAGPSRIAAAVVAPLVVLDGFAILILGRGHVAGLLERLVLLGAVAWTLAVSGRLAAGRA